MRDKLTTLSLGLFNNNLTIGTIEHCTSGLLGASISSICGISKVYGGTIVTVDGAHMEKLLDISPFVIQQNGFNSSKVASELALVGLYKLNVDVCVSVIGDVTPSANDNDKGLVWICVATNNGKKVNFRYEKLEVSGFRSENIETALNKALDVTISAMEELISDLQ